MKKIRVFELAKKKNISSREVIEMLGRKGFKKVSAITYVNPDVIDNTPKHEVKKRVEPVSHLFGVPGRGNTATARPLKKLAPINKAAAPPVKIHSGKKGKKAVAKKIKSAARPASLRQIPQDSSPKTTWKKTGAPSGKEGKNKTAFAAIGLGLALLLLVATGFLYMEMRSQRSMFASMGSELKTSVGRVDNAVVANSKQIKELDERVKGVSGEMEQLKRAGLISKLKSQSAVLGILSRNLDEPLKSTTGALAVRLAEF